MKLPFKRYAVLLTFLFLAAGRAFAMPVLVFDPSAQSVALGGQATVDINVTGLTGELIGAFDFDVNWDSSLLSLASVDFGISLGGPGFSFQDVFAGTGTVNVAESSFDDVSFYQDGITPFTLFSLTFDTLAVGTSSLAFAPGLFGDFLVDDTGFFSLLTDASATGSIQVVPVPAAVWLFGSGLLGLAGIARRRA